MESEDAVEQLRQSLRAADRAEAAPWTDYPPTPRWYPPATGVWAALLTLAVGGLEDGTRAAAVFSLVVIECCFLGWYVRYRGGVMPTGPAPREFTRAITVFVAALVAVVVGVVTLATLLSLWAGAALALVGVTAVVAWYERAYAAASDRARKRLA
jgi:hypothetical protein